MMLSPNDVLVIAFSLDARSDISAMRSLLDANEFNRARRFVHERDRTRFIVAHAVTRRVLGGYLGVSPTSLTFGAGPYGKPCLLEPAADIRFNLSHAADRGLLAVSRGRELGIDIEEQKAIDVLALADRCFSQRERAALASLPEARRLTAFYRGWTRKESFVKANGIGLSCPLQEFDVSLEEMAGNLLLNDETGLTVRDCWTIQSLSAPAGFTAAIAVEGTGWRLVFSEASWEEMDGDFLFHRG
jgi:4'-phosphopantetheinyl transferase